MGVAEVGRRRREDVGEVREEEQGREAEEEELRAVHGAGAGGWTGSAFRLRSLAGSLPFPRRGGGRRKPPVSHCQVGSPNPTGNVVPVVSGVRKDGHLLVVVGVAGCWGVGLSLCRRVDDRLSVCAVRQDACWANGSDMA
jgi:hypothetical protein